MAYQFAHLETYSRKGRDGRDVTFILKEAARRPESSVHVAALRPPELIYGLDVENLSSIHDERAAAAVTVISGGKSRAIRKDQNTLLAIVASHPARMEDARSDPILAADVAAWEKRTVEWLRQQYGDQLATVIRHTDESFPHIHAYVLPSGADMRANDLHPGSEAKRKITGAGPLDGEDGKAMNKRADAAYRSAMRTWQDSYWQSVGLPSGLTRLGPARRRLTREEWRAEQTACAAVKQATEKAAHIDQKAASFVSKTKSQASGYLENAKATAAAIEAAAVAQAEEAKRLHDEAIAKDSQANSILRRARLEGERILRTARTEADRLRSLGQRIRGIWDGLRRSAIERRLRESFELTLARERSSARMSAARIAEETRLRRQAQEMAANSIHAVQIVGRERDRARQERDQLLELTSGSVSTNAPKIP